MKTRRLCVPKLGTRAELRQHRSQAEDRFVRVMRRSRPGSR